MTGQTPFSAQLSAKLSCGLPIALLALSLTFGPSAVRAEPDSPTPSWREMLLDPIMTAVHTVEARLSSLEASIARSAGFFTSQQIATQKLCVYDNTGETCITKAQLDAVLASMARAAAAAPANAPPAAVTEAPAIVSEPSVTVTEVPAVVTEAPAIVTEAKAQDRFEQTPAETTSIVTAAPAAMPESVPEENAMEQKSAHTGSAIAASSGDALVWHPEVDISIPAPASDE